MMFENFLFLVCRDLSVKKTFDDNPILWDVMELVSSANVGFMFCSCILRGIIAPLLMFWESSREVSTRNSPQQLEASCRLVECMKRVCFSIYSYFIISQATTI
jgi:integrator complex subunit 5